MEFVKTTDNTKKCLKTAVENSTAVLADLEAIAGKTLESLEKENPNLFIFPPKNKKVKDDIEKLTLFSISDQHIVTANFMGFVSRNDTQLAITSRFYSADNDYFLHYMLHKVFAINVLDFKISTQPEAIWDIFLIYLFPNALQTALNQGLYKAYQQRQYNNAQVKGTINIARHLRQNLPFMGNVAYDVREHTYDNHMTQLIRHTVEYIKSHKITSTLLNRSQEFRTMIQQMEWATPSYRPQQRATIMTQNLKPVNHPFFTQYEFLRKLCLQILRHEGISLGQKNPDKVYGIVFDGAWLWEEYLNTILLECGFVHPRNKEQKDAVYIFQDERNNPRYPDFYKLNEIVLDAKYKWQPNNKDIDQIIMYMYVLRTKFSGFIYPTYEATQRNLIGILKGYGGQLNNYPLLIPQNAENWSTFIKMMQQEEQNLLNLFRHY